jgi:formate dehydrogenase subunit gamma
MVAETPPRAERPPRFDAAERLAHWSTAALMAAVMATAAALYIPAVATLVGRRELVKDVHVWAGLVIPFPLAFAALGRWGQQLRRDLGRLNRWQGHDFRWMRSLGRDPFSDVGRFNAGQKLNAAFVAGAVPLMMATGSIMRWFDPFPLAWRRGATFVHDWLSLVLTVVIAGHIAFAFRHRESLDAMWRGGPGPVKRKTPAGGESGGGA